MSQGRGLRPAGPTTVPGTACRGNLGPIMDGHHRCGPLPGRLIGTASKRLGRYEQSSKPAHLRPKPERSNPHRTGPSLASHYVTDWPVGDIPGAPELLGCFGKLRTKDFHASRMGAVTSSDPRIAPLAASENGTVLPVGNPLSIQ